VGPYMILQKTMITNTLPHGEEGVFFGGGGGEGCKNINSKEE
jgi:hypothetical protein